MSNPEDEDGAYPVSISNEGDAGEDYNDYNDYDNERSSRNIEGSPIGSDGDESYDRRNRFRRRDSEISEPDNSHQQVISSENTDSSHSYARKSGALQSSRNDPDPQYQQRDNRRGNYNNRYDNNRRNNNYQQNHGNRQYPNNNYNNQYNQPHQPYVPAAYPAYPSYPGAGYVYDPMAPPGGYYPPPMGYLPAWNSGAGYSHPPPPNTSGSSSGYFYGTEYGAQSGVAAATGYGYGATNQSGTAATTADSGLPSSTSANEEKEDTDQPSADEPTGNAAPSNTGSYTPGASSVPPPSSDGSIGGATTGYNLSGMGVYTMHSSPNHNYHHQQQPRRQHQQQHMHLPRESNKANRPAVKNLPENERCTLRCTSIPVHITEEDLKAHFESFGHVVELQVSPMENQNGDDNDDGNEDSKKKKKACNECLVQFYSAGNARRCLTSEVPVLNNRFIFIYQSHFNIIPPQDVPRPSRDIIDRDAYLLQLKDIVPAASAAQAAASRKRTALNMYATGMTNKWRRTDKDDASAPATKVPGESTTHDVANEEGEEEKDTADASSVGPVATQSAASKAAADEMKQSLLRQKQLKQQAEDLLKKKEDVLINQIEKCRTMMEKLEKAPDSDSKAKNLQYLEDKIVDLQSQLRDVREQVHQQQQQQAAIAGTGEKPSPSGKPPMGFFRGGYPGRFPGRGRGGGRVWMGSARGGGRFAGGRFPPRPAMTPQTSFNNPFAAKPNATAPNAFNEAEQDDNELFNVNGGDEHIQGGADYSDNLGDDGVWDDGAAEGN